MENKRDIKETIRVDWIVSLRALATLAVVLLHVVAGWLDNSKETITGSRMILDEIVIQVFVRWAVPCFIMISGALLLNPLRQMEIEKIKKYIMRMLKVLLTFGLAYCFIELVANGYRNPIEILLFAFKNLLEGNSWSHMWYVYMIMGLYMITPMLRDFLKVTNESTLKFTLLILFFFGIVRPTINNLFQIQLAQVIPISTAYVFYYEAVNFFVSLN